MKIYNIEFSKEARGDLEGIKNYIKNNLHEPEIAERLIFKIREETQKLKRYPNIYPMINENKIREFKIRKLIVCNYIVFYIVEDDKIIITRILHKKRNWINLI